MDRENLLEKEAAFHDEWADTIKIEDVPVDETFELSTSPEAKWLFNQVGDVKGKRVLELGSGAGEGSVYFAKHGARVTATDISPGMIDVVKKVAAHHNTSLEDARVCSADDLSCFEENSFDIVYAANLLHHVDIEKTITEAKKVLKPGGVALFWDPVAHNPVINVYRRMAMAVRTEDEHPIKYSELKIFKKHFSQVNRKFFWLTSLIIFLKFFLINRIHPSSDRYWKLILTKENEIRGTYKFFSTIDEIILKVFPPLGWWCWNIAIVCKK